MMLTTGMTTTPCTRCGARLAYRDEDMTTGLIEMRCGLCGAVRGELDAAGNAPKPDPPLPLVAARGRPTYRERLAAREGVR